MILSDLEFGYELVKEADPQAIVLAGVCEEGEVIYQVCKRLPVGLPIQTVEVHELRAMNLFGRTYVKSRATSYNDVTTVMIMSVVCLNRNKLYSKPRAELVFEIWEALRMTSKAALRRLADDADNDESGFGPTA